MNVVGFIAGGREISPHRCIVPGKVGLLRSGHHIAFHDLSSGTGPLATRGLDKIGFFRPLADDIEDWRRRSWMISEVGLMSEAKAFGSAEDSVKNSGNGDPLVYDS